MSAEALVQKITTEQEAAVAELAAAAAKQVAAIEAAATAEAEELSRVAAAKSAKEAAQLKRVALSKARQAAKLTVQAAKREAFDAIMAAAEAEVTDGDVTAARRFSDQRASLELVLANAIS